MTKTKKRLTPSSEAARILQQHANQIPIDLEMVLDAHNISLRKHEMEDSVSGMLVIKNGQSVIGVNNAHHPNRQRFTIAHELGHYLLHADESKVFVDNIFFRDADASEGMIAQEVQANTFAAELLMPEQFIRDEVKKHPIDSFDDISLRRLAATLEVSVQALTIRLTKLGLLQ